jgi:hypothetical protein
MDVGTMAVILFGALVVFFFLLGKLTRGSGAGVVDIDPVGRASEERALDEEDAAQLARLVGAELPNAEPPGHLRDG